MAAPVDAVTNLLGAEVVVDAVGKTFRRGRRTVALSRASLRVRPGELTCLLGPSGCGKSTLLRIIAGALAADEGTVTVETAGHRPVPRPGHAVPDANAVRLAHHEDNILFGPRAQRAAGQHERDDPELDEEAAALLERVAWPVSATRSRTNCRAACGTGLRSPGRWRRGRRCC